MRHLLHNANVVINIGHFQHQYVGVKSLRKSGRISNILLHKTLQWKLSFFSKQSFLLSICTGIFGTFDILQFDELGFFSSLKTNWIFLPVQTGFFSKFLGYGKIFWWTLLNYLFPFYNLQRYTLPVFGLVDSLNPLLCIKEMETLEIPSLFTLKWHF